MKPKSNPFLRALALTSSIVLSFTASAFAATYQWTGVTDSDWTKATNWPAATGITVGPPPVSGAHRINIKNGANFEAVYDSTLGTRTYGGSNIKGLVIGNPGNARMRITGGKFVTQGTTTTSDLSAGVDAVGNTNGIAEFIIDGGEYESGVLGLTLGLGNGPTSSLTINNGGLATISTLNHNATLATTTLNAGGTLAVNKISRNTSSTAGNFNLNGGTLRARQNEPAFVSGLTAFNVNSTSTLDTATFNIGINSPISGSATINVTNGGNLTLTAQNPFTGTLSMPTGTLSLTPTAGTFASFSGNLSGNAALEIAGAGISSINGTNSHTGGNTVLNGANLGGEGSVPGELIFQGTHIFYFNPATTGTNQHFRAGSINATGAAVSIAALPGPEDTDIVVMEAIGGITGLIGTNFLGSSRVALSYNTGQTQLLAAYTPASLTWKGDVIANPTFWDTTTANWDNAGSPGTFVPGDNVLFDDNATGYTVALQATMLPGTVTFDHTNNNYTVSGSAIGGTANLVKTGSGSLFLNNANTYTGITTITGGTLVAGNNAALGTTDGGTIISGTGILDINNKNLGTEVITISGAGDGSGAIINTGAEQINAIGRLVLAGDASIGGSGNRWDLRNSSPTLDMGTGVGAPFTLTKAGSNYVALVGVTVSNPGDIVVENGTLSIQTGTTMAGSSSNSITVRTGATLSTYQAANPTSWSIVMEDSTILRCENTSANTQNIWTGPVTLEDAGNVTFQADGTMTVAGDISGTGSSISKTGNYTTALAGNNSYTGTTTVSAGVLALQNASALGGTVAGTSVTSGARVELDNVTITGEEITIAGNGGDFFGALQGRAGSSVWSGNVIVDADLTRIGAKTGATLEVSGVISSTSTHNVIFRPQDASATVILSNANTYTGPTSVIGGIVSVSDIGSVAGGPSNFGSPTSVADGTIKMSSGATGTLRYTGIGETTDRVIDLQGTTNGAFIEQAGDGLLKFTNDFTATGAGTKLLVLDGSTAGTGEIAGAIVDNLTGTNLTNLRKDGSGTWTLSGTNTYSGSTLINVGTLVVSNASGLGSTAAGTTVAGNGLFGTLALTGSITITGEALALGARQDAIIDVPHVSNLAGNNTWTGDVTFDVGGLDYNLESQAGLLTMSGQITAGTLTGNRNLKLMGAGNGEVSGVITNGTNVTPATVRVTKTGAGTWTLSGTNLYTGATNVNQGTLVIGSTGSIDASTALTVAAGAELDTTAKSSHTLPATVTIGLDGTSATSGLIDATGQALDIDGSTVTFSVAGALTAPVYVLANYGSISGTQSFALITPPDGYDVVYNHNGGTQIALVQSAASGYGDWATTYAGGQAANLDFDYDGVDNGIEYFLNATTAGFTASPTSFTGNTATWTNGGKIPFGDYGNQFYIQTSPDLVNWTKVLAGDANLNNQAGSVAYTLNGTGKQFVRLVVTPN